MLLTDIDEKFVYIINYLKDQGYKTFASCDGTLETHKDDKFKPINAYIAFIRSPLIIDLLSAFIKDRDTFTVSINNARYPEREYFGNILSGNEYAVYFKNLKNERTDYFTRIIEGITRGDIKAPKSERSLLQKFDDKLAGLDDSDLAFRVDFNINHIYVANRSEKTNLLTIDTKKTSGTVKRLETLGKMLSERFGLELKNLATYDAFQGGKLPSSTEHFPEEYIFDYGQHCEISLKSENVERFLEIIDYIRSIEKDLPTREAVKHDYSQEDDYYEEDYSDEDYGDDEFDGLDADESHSDEDYVGEDIDWKQIGAILDGDGSVQMTEAPGKTIDDFDDTDLTL